MPASTLPPIDDPDFLRLVKDYWLPITGMVGTGVIGWVSAILNSRSKREKDQAGAVADQLNTLMDGYQEHLKIMQAGYEGRIRDLKDDLNKLETRVDDLRRALDKRPACENCPTRARLEGELEASRTHLHEHVQFRDTMGDVALLEGT